jgi:hypothetical protein
MLVVVTKSSLAGESLPGIADTSVSILLTFVVIWF